jgi:hypothetical protein
MQIRIDYSNRTPSSAGLIISHRSEQLIWDIPSQDVMADFDIFKEINGYWDQLPEAVQDRIFSIYVKINECLMNDWVFENQITTLRPLIADLFRAHPEEDVYIWVWTKADVSVPSGPNGIKRTYDPRRDDHRIERTYIEDDYRKLIALSVAMRIMIPVWGQFMLNSKSRTDNMFKEYQAFSLLALAPVMEWEAMKRFTVFVNYTLPKDRALDAVIISGLSSHDFPLWVLAMTVVRRLCRGDVRGNNPDATLVAHLFVYLSQRLRSIESTTGKIIGKTTIADHGESDSNLSVLENFKIKESVPAGDVAAVSFYIGYQLNKVLSDEHLGPLALANRLSYNWESAAPGQPAMFDPKFPNLVKLSHASVQALATERLTKVQVMLSAWTLSRYVPIRSIPNLQKTDLLGIITFAQAYLWHHGHRELAALCSAVSRNDNEQTMSALAVSMDAIEKPEMAELIKRFPYRKRTSSRSKTARSTIPVLQTIDDMVDMVAQQTWNLTLPKEWVSQMTGHARNRRYNAPSNLRTKLARLIIELDDRTARVLGVRDTIFNVTLDEFASRVRTVARDFTSNERATDVPYDVLTVPIENPFTNA